MDYFRNLYRTTLQAGRPARDEFEMFKPALDALEKRAVAGPGGKGIDVPLPRNAPVLAAMDARLYSCGVDAKNGSFIVLVGRHYVLRYSHCAPANGLFLMMGLGQGEQIGEVEHDAARDVHSLHMEVGRLGVFGRNADYEGLLAEPLDPLVLIRQGRIGLPVEAELLVRLEKQ